MQPSPACGIASGGARRSPSSRPPSRSCAGRISPGAPPTAFEKIRNAASDRVARQRAPLTHALGRRRRLRPPFAAHGGGVRDEGREGEFGRCSCAAGRTNDRAAGGCSPTTSGCGRWRTRSHRDDAAARRVDRRCKKRGHDLKPTPRKAFKRRTFFISLGRICALCRAQRRGRGGWAGTSGVQAGDGPAKVSNDDLARAVRDVSGERGGRTLRQLSIPPAVGRYLREHSIRTGRKPPPLPWSCRCEKMSQTSASWRNTRQSRFGPIYRTGAQTDTPSRAPMVTTWRLSEGRRT